MFYHTYNTEAFVLGSEPAGEASKYVYLFTRDLGLVGVRAQSVRSVSSKLRFALEPLSHSKVSLVRGKNSWRLTNAAAGENLFNKFRGDKDKLVLCANIFVLIKKLLAGEEENPELFNILDDAINFIKKEDLNTDQIKNTEAILMLRLLKNLGYLADTKSLENFTNSGDWNTAILDLMNPKRKQSIATINESLKVTHLS